MAERFQVSLPADVTAWLDEECWKRPTVVPTVGEPIAPEAILDPRSARVWGGQHLPDTLPFFDDGTGTVACLRFAPDGIASEWVLWEKHGNWRPLGRTLAEVFLYAEAANAAGIETEPPAPARKPWWRFWGPAPPPEEPPDRMEWVDWALRWVCSETPALRALRKAIELRDPETGLDCLLQAGMGKVAVHRDRCAAACTSKLEQYCCERGGQEITHALGVEWPQLSAWLVDTARIPGEARKRLGELFPEPVEDLLRQDWDRAEREAREVLRSRDDLPWPYAVLGYAAERRGETRTAAGIYLEGLHAFGSAQDFTEFWKDLGSPDPVKFGVQRLAVLRPHLAPELLDNPYLQEALADAFNVERYWLRRAQQAEAEGRLLDAYRCYYRAGWDEFYSQDEERLDQLADAADQAGAFALREIARHHRKTLG